MSQHAFDKRSEELGQTVRKIFKVPTNMREFQESEQSNQKMNSINDMMDDENELDDEIASLRTQIQAVNIFFTLKLF
jgi:hypothetical protein